MPIYLERVLAGDASRIFESWASEEQLFQYLNFSHHNHVSDSELWLDHFLADERNIGFHIVCASTNSIIGFCRATVVDGTAHLGFLINDSNRGRGFATVALGKLLNELTEPGVESFHASCHKDNEASQKVLLKNGFAKYGHKDDQFYFRSFGN